MKKLLYHIDIGDGDNLFMLAKDKLEVKQRIDKKGEFSSDMINSIIELPLIQEQIEKQERERILLLLDNIQNPYPEDIFPTTIEEAGKYLREKMGDEKTTAISGAICRLGYGNAIRDVRQALKGDDHD